VTLTVVPRRAAADDEDRTLVAAIAAGDDAALAAVYDRYGRPCYALARRITGDDGLAAEVVQDTFLNLWRHPGRYDATRGRFAGWLLAVAHHRAVDAVRREQPHRARRDSIGLLDGVPDNAVDVGDQVEARERAGQARAALAALPPPQREAVLLAYYGGYTQREIAGLLGVPLGTVKTRTAAALTRLRGMLATTDEGER
jgi:RNA polymerase sigma-70 factor (ECF subfamily)